MPEVTIIPYNIPSLRLDMATSDVEEIAAGVRRVLSSGRLTLGNETASFEREFAEFAGVPYACAVNSGTAALEVALRILRVAGKPVLVPSNTFFATAAAVIHAGGRPRFVDCDPQTLALAFDSMARKWTPDCAGVIAVHVGGPIAADIHRVQRFCKERGMFLLEDAAHAHGSRLSGIHPGNFGDAAAFSFYPTKVMTSGEGGMLVTKNEAVYREALIYRDQGKESYSNNFHVRLGYNWRMSELHAVVGRSQLRRLAENLRRRREIAHRYDEALRGLENVQPLAIPSNSESNYYKYPVFLPRGLSRAALKERLKAESKVSLSGEVYSVPCHQQPIFEGYADGNLPGAEEACQRHICLPLYPNLSDSEVDYVVFSLAQALSAMKEEVPH